MRLIVLLTVVACLQSSAAVYSQQISINVSNEPLKDVMQQISGQSGYTVFTDARILDKAKNVTAFFERASLTEALKKIFYEQPLTYEILGKTIVIKSKEVATIFPVTGHVINENGTPIAGATISVKGKPGGVMTNVDGSFAIDVSSAHDSLVITYVGYVTQVVAAGSGNIIIILKPDVQQQNLSEVVVVGYGTQKKVTVTGALASIPNEELVKSPQANISNSLVGRLPGLMAVQRSGQPGESQSIIRIRGVGTFNGSADPLVMVDGIEGINYNNIDPGEIESISILKDASSTAVYGVRGANGVVLITTKRGKTSKPQVSISSNFANTRFTNIRKGVSSYDYAIGYNEARKYDSYLSGGYAPKFTAEAIEKYKTGEDPLFYPSTDWFNTMFKKSSSQMQHNLNIRGGTNKVKYFTSIGFYNENGLFNSQITDFITEYNAQPRFTRYNFRTNFDFQITKDFSVGMDISSQTEQRRGNTTNINRILEIMTKANPTISPGIYDGKLITLGNTGAEGEMPHSQMLINGYTRDFRNYLNGTINLLYKLNFITKGLSTRAKVSYLNFNRENRGFSKTPILYLPTKTTDNNVVYVPQDEENPFTSGTSISKFRREYFEYGVDYNRTFGRHTTGGLVLYNQNKLYDPTLAYAVPEGYQGLVGRVTYDYDNRYMLEYNLGYNGTENFAPGKRFGFFPAYSVGWVPTREKFFPKNNILTFLKIRGSYGEVGNDKIGGERFLYRPSSYSYASNYYYFGEIGSNYAGYQGSTEGKIGNPDLTWERAKKLNVGADIQMWQDKVKITADWFSENRDNILANLGTVPTVVGANLPAYNLGKMKNSGYDAEIGYKDNINAFNYWVKANYTYAHNVIEFMDEPKRPYPYLQGTGQRAGQFFGLIAEGFYNTWEEVNDPNRPKSSYNNNKIQPGDIKYKDVNGDGTIDYLDQVPIGYSNFPEKIYSFSLGGDWKEFDFSVLFQGADNVSVSYSRHARYGFREGASVPFYILNESWTQQRYEQGQTINFPHLAEGDVNQKHNYEPSTMWIRNSSYLRLKNVDVGYTLSKKITDRLRINSIRIFANANNLFTWSDMLPGIDPESNVAGANYEPYPLVKTVNFGFNVNF